MTCTQELTLAQIIMNTEPDDINFDVVECLFLSGHRFRPRRTKKKKKTIGEIVFSAKFSVCLVNTQKLEMN